MAFVMQSLRDNRTCTSQCAPWQIMLKTSSCFVLANSHTFKSPILSLYFHPPLFITDLHKEEMTSLTAEELSLYHLRIMALHWVEMIRKLYIWLLIVYWWNAWQGHCERPENEHRLAVKPTYSPWQFRCESAILLSTPLEALIPKSSRRDGWVLSSPCGAYHFGKQNWWNHKLLLYYSMIPVSKINTWASTGCVPSIRRAIQH